MDFYKRKAQAKMLIKRLIEKGAEEETICKLIEDTYQFSHTWTKKELGKQTK